MAASRCSPASCPAGDCRQRPSAARAGPDVRVPEQAAIAAARAVEYERWRTRPHGAVPEFPDTRPDEASAIVATALERGPGWLTPSEVEGVLSCYGIPVVATRIVPHARGAGELASELEPPLVLKVVGPIHKTDVGGVVLDLRDQRRSSAARPSSNDG